MWMLQDWDEKAGFWGFFVQGIQPVGLGMWPSGYLRHNADHSPHHHRYPRGVNALFQRNIGVNDVDLDL